MPEKDPNTYAWLTYAWVVFLSVWGGFVSFYRKLKSGRARAFNVMELIGELTTSAFAGVLTFLFCGYAQIDGMLTAAFVGIAGHMGSRAIAQMEDWASKRFGGSNGP
jgi:hypothetical protein